MLRPEINEKLSVGLILVNNKQVSFFLSEDKLFAVKKLVPQNIFNGIKNSIKLIEKSFNQKMIKANNSQQVLELNIVDKSDVFNFEYFDYLKKYNNNLLTFSQPINIDIEYTDKLFQKLFHKFIDEKAFSVKELKPKSPIENFKKVFYPKVKKFYNIEQEINPQIYPELIMPIKIDLMGKNEGEVFAQSIDMSKNLRSIEYGISALMHINRALPKAKQFIITSEPEKSNELNHKIWSNIRHLNEFEYVDLQESEKIAEYAREHNVVPLLTKNR